MAGQAEDPVIGPFRLPVSLITVRIWSMYSVQCGQCRRWASNRWRSRRGESIFEVLRDKLDDLLAREGRAATKHGTSNLNEFGLEGLAHSASTSMQQNPLIRFGDLEDVTNFGAVHPFKVTECHHAPLLYRQFIERGPDGRRQLSGLKPVVQVVAPVLRRQ